MCYSNQQATYLVNRSCFLPNRFSPCWSQYTGLRRTIVDLRLHVCLHVRKTASSMWTAQTRPPVLVSSRPLPSSSALERPVSVCNQSVRIQDLYHAYGNDQELYRRSIDVRFGADIAGQFSPSPKSGTGASAPQKGSLALSKGQ